MSTMRTASRFLFTLCLIACLPACTQKAAPPSAATQTGGHSSVALQPGQPLFAFRTQTISDLLIVKADPETGDRWSAHLRNNGAEWEIDDLGSSTPLLDRHADSGFVVHLLDTLKTLQPSQIQVQGPLESLGLATPRFALQWQSTDSTQGFEVRIGTPKRGTGDAYAWVPGQPPFLVNGATLQMLEHLTHLSVLRNRLLAGGVGADEIEVIELKGNSPFYAQREGAKWTDRSHKLLRKNIQAWIEGVAHARVSRFIDDASEAEKGRQAINAHLVAEIKLTDSSGKLTAIKVGRAGKQWVALNSQRPTGVFEIFPEVMRFFKPPK